MKVRSGAEVSMSKSPRQRTAETVLQSPSVKIRKETYRSGPERVETVSEHGSDTEPHFDFVQFLK